MSLDNKKPTLCLNMIVKNESKTIIRLLDSVISIIDTYCICDTGSTDDTVHIIQNYFDQKHIHGKVIIEPFQNFSYNRNYAFNACKDMSDYVLLLDADMKIELNNFDKDKQLNLLTDYFDILQGDDNFQYNNTRIVKNNLNFKYVGVTHEYVDKPPNCTNKLLSKDKIFIRDYGDGGCKQNKYERDIKLLSEGIENEPNNVRYYFYLANSYYDIGKYNNAIEIYKKRIELGGWNEEVWYSYYRIGLCYKSMQRFDDAVINWIEGYNVHPKRIENLYEIILYYKDKSKHNLCELFYNKAKNIINENNDHSQYLFLHKDIYDYKLIYEYTIFAYYIGIRNIDKEIIYILNNCSDDGIINNIFSNLKFYITTLKSIKNFDLCEKIKLTIPKVSQIPIAFTSSSSCILPKNDYTGFYLNIRYVNYNIDSNNGNYLNCDEHIITVNKYLELNNKLQVLKSGFFVEPSDNANKYIGVEDIRIFYEKNNQLSFIGTGLHNDNTLGIFYGFYDVDNNTLIKNEVKTNFNNRSCEKNWVHFNYYEDDCFIYEWYPLQICKIDNYVLKHVKNIDMPNIFKRARGSTNGFNYIQHCLNNSGQNNINCIVTELEIWFIVHFVCYETPRNYYHMFVKFDKNMQLISYSAPFKFDNQKIEYCLSLLVNENHVTVTLSCWDKTTFIRIYDKNYIDSLMVYKS